MSIETPPKLLWGLTGSVATIRADQLLASLTPLAEVRIMLSRSAQHFLPVLPAEYQPFTDEHEWEQWQTLGDPVLHIELRRWADLLLIAPLSANSLAKLANGICDNLVLSVARAWDFQKPVLVAPAMNTFMWQHPVTQEHLDKIRHWGIHIIEPVEKKLACEDVGIGGLASGDTIQQVIRELIIAATS